jgi:hypothetical protein
MSSEQCPLKGARGKNSKKTLPITYPNRGYWKGLRLE